MGDDCRRPNFGKAGSASLSRDEMRRSRRNRLDEECDLTAGYQLPTGHESVHSHATASRSGLGRSKVPLAVLELEKVSDWMWSRIVTGPAMEHRSGSEHGSRSLMEPDYESSHSAMEPSTELGRRGTIRRSRHFCLVVAHAMVRCSEERLRC